MIHEVVQAFLNEDKIEILDPDSNHKYFFKRGSYILFEDSKNASHIVGELITFPCNFRIYQEPKKAWIDTDASEFYSRCYALKGVGLFKDGAIVLAREFLKRYDEIKFRKPMGEPIVSKIMSELVGEENLK